MILQRFSSDCEMEEMSNLLDFSHSFCSWFFKVHLTVIVTWILMMLLLRGFYLYHSSVINVLNNSADSKNAFKQNSPARRRRISVKSSHVRKISRTQRQRRITVSTNSVPLSQQHSFDTGSRSIELNTPGVLASTIVPSRKLSVALGRKVSTNVPPNKRPVRRCSEPFLFDPVTLQNKWNRKISSNVKGYGRRRLSTTAVFPTSAKQKLQALAKDELLASLNVPLITDQVVPPTEESENVNIDVRGKETQQDLENERREEKRLRVLNEILETEKNYISCLETLNIVFKNQLATNGIMTEKDLHSLFPHYLDEIKESHSWFMLELEERMHNKDWKGIIGDIFAKMTSSYKANLLEIYTNYVNAFPKSISTLSKCTRSSQKFRKFLEDCYDNPLVERLDLPSFLLSPVQRLPRYVLLLRELLKYTQDEHPDRYFIDDAMVKMQALISSLNGSIQNSMDFYVASDEKRKIMSRQMTKRSRKKRSSSGRGSILHKKNSSKEETKSLPDADQGYCSFSETKKESPDDNLNSPNQSFDRIGKRSMSMSAAEQNREKNGVVLRKRKDDGASSGFSRNSESRKSWRRSLGAVFSSLWSTKEEKEMPAENNNSDKNEKRDSLLRVDGQSPDPPRRLSTAKRKNGIASPTRTTADVEFPPSPVSVSLESSSPNDDSHASPSLEVRVPQTPNTALFSHSSSQEQVTSSLEQSVDFPQTSFDRRGSSTSLRSSPSANSSPIPFQRNKYRSSAGPAIRSIFSRNKMQRNLSWQDLQRGDEEKVVSREAKLIRTEEKRHSGRKLSLRKFRSKAGSRDSLGRSFEENTGKPSSAPESPAVHKYLEQNADDISISSTDTSPDNRKASISSSVTGDDALENRSISSSSLANNNNVDAVDAKPSKEKKKKFMKSLRNFVGKKQV